MQKLTFIVPPSPFLENDDYPPLGLLSVATYIKSQGYDVEVFKWDDLNFDNDYECLAIGGVTAHYHYFQKLAQLFPNTPKIIGGPHAMADPASLSKSYTVVIGEGEYTLLSLLRAYNEFGKYFRSIVKPLEDYLKPNISELPIVDRSLAPWYDYEKEASIMLGRGCTYHCAFCFNPYNTFKMRDVGHIEKEVIGLKELYGTKFFVFYDDDILLNNKWLVEFCAMMSQYDTPWRSQARTTFFNEEKAELLSKAGCVKLSFGIESGSQKILDNVHKRTKVAQNVVARNICREHGIAFKAFIMLGLPGEDQESLEETRAWILENKPDEVGLYIYRPFPGTRIWECQEDYDIKFDKTEPYENFYYAGLDIDCMVSTSALSSDDIVHFKQELEAELNYAQIRH